MYFNFTKIDKRIRAVILRSKCEANLKKAIVTSITVGLLTVPALLFPPVTAAAELVVPGGGVLTHIVDGGGARTTITLVNVDSLPSPYTLAFFGNDGSPATFQTTAGPTSTPLSGTLNPSASLIIRTNGGAGTMTEGWALLLTGQNGKTMTDANGAVHYSVGASAVFSLVLPGNPVAEATVPMETLFTAQFELPFDYTTGATGVAIANAVSNNPLTLNVTAYDLSGNPIPLATSSLQLPRAGHTSFMLTEKFPELTGKQGTVVFSGVGNSDNPNGYSSLLGLRVNLANTSLSTVTPLSPCNQNAGKCTVSAF